MQDVLPINRSLSSSLGVDLIEKRMSTAAYRPTKSNLRRKSFQEAPFGPSNSIPFSDSPSTRAPARQTGRLRKTGEAWVRHGPLPHWKGTITYRPIASLRRKNRELTNSIRMERYAGSMKPKLTTK
jgi:hypothetical protein